MTTKHTPGPWKVEFVGPKAVVSIFTPSGLPHETGWAIFSVQPYDKPAEARANARLIAAAPDLEACAYCIEDLGDELEAALIGDTLEEFQRVRAMFRAAIAKAEAV